MATEDGANVGALRLGTEVRDRRKFLGMSQQQLADVTEELDDSDVASPGVSRRRLGSIERGEVVDVRASTLAVLDEALQWPQGTAAGLLYGAAESPLEPDRQRLADLEDEVAELRRLVARIVERFQTMTDLLDE